MTMKQIQDRNEKAQELRVVQIDEGWFYVESSEGKICYKVMISDEKKHCTCADYTANINKDPNFKCKHILAVLNCLSTGEIETVGHFDRRKPKLDERFIKSIEGKDFVLYSGLLDLAHQKGLLKLSVQILQYPTPENKNWAICTATAESSQFGTFVDVGDASPDNCNSKISRHLIRMASTRAKARALRDLTNIGMCCLEELADLDEVTGNETMANTRETKSKKAGSPRTNTKPAEGAKPTNPGSNGGNSADKKNEPHPDNPNQGKSEAKQEPPKSEPTKPPVPPQGSTKAEPSTKTKTTANAETRGSNGGNNNGGNSNGGSGNVPKMSEAQKRAVHNLSRRRGITVEELEQMALKTYNVSLDYLSSQDASAFIRQLQSAA